MKTHFIAAARRIMEQEYAAGRRPTLAEIARFTIHHTHPPDYGVCYDRAVATVSAVLRRRQTGRPAGRLTVRRAMWEELADRVSRRMTHCGQPLGRAVQWVITDSHPSRWWISESTALRWLGA